MNAVRARAPCLFKKKKKNNNNHKTRRKRRRRKRRKGKQSKNPSGQGGGGGGGQSKSKKMLLEEGVSGVLAIPTKDVNIKAAQGAENNLKGEPNERERERERERARDRESKRQRKQETERVQKAIIHDCEAEKRFAFIVLLKHLLRTCGFQKGQYSMPRLPLRS